MQGNGPKDDNTCRPNGAAREVQTDDEDQDDGCTDCVS